MESLIKFLKDFLNNKGHYVFLSLLISKISGFLGSLIIIRLLPENEFGTISIVASLFFVFISFSGFGSQQSLLRYGAISESERDKTNLAQYLLKKGFTNHLLLSFIFLLVGIFYINKYEDIFYIFIIFTVRLIGYYFFIHIQAQFRVFNKNKDFARVSNVVNISGIAFLLIFTYFFGIQGYLISIAITPFVSLFWFKREQFTLKIKPFKFNKPEIWNYGAYAAGNTLLSDALFSIDILLLSFIMNENAVANYRVAILIPVNITFLAATFMQSDYTLIAKNSKNKLFLKNYIFNFYKLFIPISVVIFILGFIFRYDILLIFFGERYTENTIVFSIFLGAFCINMLCRNLYANLLAAVGLIKINSYISALNLLILIILALLFVENFGIIGLAGSVSVSMIFSGLLLLIAFRIYYRKLN